MLSRKLKAAQSHGTGAPCDFHLKFGHIKYPPRTPPYPNPQPQTVSSNSSNVPLDKLFLSTVNKNTICLHNFWLYVLTVCDFSQMGLEWRGNYFRNESRKFLCPSGMTYVFIFTAFHLFSESLHQECALISRYLISLFAACWKPLVMEGFAVPMWY